jgi:hypothetical protein
LINSKFAFFSSITKQNKTKQKDVHEKKTTGKSKRRKTNKQGELNTIK